MNRKLIVSILAIILAITMILSVVLAALPQNAFAHMSALRICTDISTALPMIPTLAV